MTVRTNDLNRRVLDDGRLWAMIEIIADGEEQAVLSGLPRGDPDGKTGQIIEEGIKAIYGEPDGA